MKSRKIILMICLFCMVNSLQGQTYFNSLFQGSLLEHPAYFVSDNSYQLGLFRKQQWEGFNETSALSFQKSLSYDRLNLGLVYIHQNFQSISKLNSISIPVSYQLKAFKGKISFGIKTGLDNESLDFNNFNSLNSGDAFFETSTSKWGISFSTGGYYKDDKNEFGISFNNISGRLISEVKNQLSMVYCKSFELNSKLKLEPYVFFKTTQNNNVIQLLTKLTFDNYGWVGVLGSVNGRVALSAGISLKNVVPRISKDMMITYGYNKWLNNLSILGNIHEIGVNYNFRLRPSSESVKQNKIIDSPILFD